MLSHTHWMLASRKKIYVNDLVRWWPWMSTSPCLLMVLSDNNIIKFFSLPYWSCFWTNTRAVLLISMPSVTEQLTHTSVLFVVKIKKVDFELLWALYTYIVDMWGDDDACVTLQFYQGELPQRHPLKRYQFKVHRLQKWPINKRFFNLFSCVGCA